jgi:hypothetical protein
MISGLRDRDEAALGLVRDCLRQERLAVPGRPVQKDATARLDAELVEAVRIHSRPLDEFAQSALLGRQPADVVVRYVGRVRILPDHAPDIVRRFAEQVEVVVALVVKYRVLAEVQLVCIERRISVVDFFDNVEEKRLCDLTALRTEPVVTRLSVLLEYDRPLPGSTDDLDNSLDRELFGPMAEFRPVEPFLLDGQLSPVRKTLKVVSE